MPGAANELDLRGKVCPFPTLDTRTAFLKLGAGESLVVVTDYYPARQTIPELIESLGGHCMLIEDGALIRFLISRAANP